METFVFKFFFIAPLLLFVFAGCDSSDDKTEGDGTNSDTVDSADITINADTDTITNLETNTILTNGTITTGDADTLTKPNTDTDLVTGSDRNTDATSDIGTESDTHVATDDTDEESDSLADTNRDSLADTNTEDGDDGGDRDTQTHGDTDTEKAQAINMYLASLPAWEDPSVSSESADDQAGDSTRYYAPDEDGKVYVCETTPYSITATPDAIATFDPSTEILWLGSLIQGKSYRRGLAALEELPIRKRAPLTIALQLINTPDVQRTVNNPTMASVNPAIVEMVTSAESSEYEPSSTMSFEMQNYYSLEQSMLSMGLSANYMGASVSSQLEINRTREQRSVMAYFRQRMFTVSLVLPETPSEFFSSDFTVDDLKTQEALGRIGVENLPTFVSSITYGRMLVMTMTSSYSEDEMKASLKASYDGFVDISADVSTKHREVLKQSEINIVAVGGEEENARELIKSGNLRDYFEDDVSLTSAVPLSYTLRNLADNSPALMSETTEYERMQCSYSYDVVVYYDDKDLWHNAVIALPGGQEVQQGIEAEEIVDAAEIDILPDDDEQIGLTLSFFGADTYLPLDFEFSSPECSDNGMTYNDSEFTFADANPSLSVGKVDECDDDDFEITVTSVSEGISLNAIGIMVGDSETASDEYLKVYGENDILLKEFTESNASLPDVEVDFTFMGIVSAVPLTRIYFNEGEDEDDICVKDFFFGISSRQ